MADTEINATWFKGESGISLAGGAILVHIFHFGDMGAD